MVPGASLGPFPPSRPRASRNKYGMEIFPADFTGPRCVRVPGMGPIGATPFGPAVSGRRVEQSTAFEN